MATWVSQRSGNWSRTSNNADSPWYDGGAQTALATVPGASGSDTATITAAQTITYDYDMSSVGVMAGVLINGVLAASTTPGNYYLKMSGVAGNNITFGTSGQLQAGSSTTPYPSGCVFTIDENGSSQINCAGSSAPALSLWCLEPIWNAVVIGAESALSTVLDITGYRRTSDGIIETGQDLTTDPMWAPTRGIRINHVRANFNDSEARVIASTSATAITITAGLTALKAAGSIVCLTWRNVRIINNTGSNSYPVASNATNCYIGAEINLGSNSWGPGGASIITRGVFHGGTRGLVAAGQVVSGSAVFAGVAAAVEGGSSITIGGHVLLTGSSECLGRIAGLTLKDDVLLTGNNSGVAGCTGARVLDRVNFKGNNNGITSTSYPTIQGTVSFTQHAYGLTTCHGTIIQGSVSFGANTYGIFGGSTRRFSNVSLSGNTNDLYGLMTLDGDGATLASTTQFGNYRAAVAGEALQSVIWNIGTVSGAVKAWMYGGRVASVATQPANWPGGVPFLWSYEHTLEASSHRCWLEKPIYTTMGQRVLVEVYIQQSVSGMAVPATAVLVTPEDSIPAPISPLATATVAENTGWQKLTLDYTPISTRKLLLRVYAANASGSVTWAEVVTLGEGTPPSIGGNVFRRS